MIIFTCILLRWLPTEQHFIIHCTMYITFETNNKTVVCWDGRVLTVGWKASPLNVLNSKYLFSIIDHIWKFFCTTHLVRWNQLDLFKYTHSLLLFGIMEIKILFFFTYLCSFVTPILTFGIWSLNINQYQLNEEREKDNSFNII